MARNKDFYARDSHPFNCSFKHAAPCAGLDGIAFTPYDTACYNAMEFEGYGRGVSMSRHGKALRRRRVAAGHDHREMPSIGHPRLAGFEPYDFLGVHRTDKEIRRGINGMDKAEQKTYRMERMAWTDEPGWDTPWPEYGPCSGPFEDYFHLLEGGVQ